jgi:hypothetical protein
MVVGCAAGRFAKDIAFIFVDLSTHTHTHTHTKREREREREAGTKSRKILQIYNRIFIHSHQKSILNSIENNWKTFRKTECVWV